MSSLKISYALISVVGFLMPAMGWSGPHDRLGSITRFHEVTEGVYRGSAPLNLDVDLALLKDLGVKTVINLQGEANERPQVEAERRVAKNLGIRLLHYGMPSAWTSLGRLPAPKLIGLAPQDEVILGALRAALDPANQPVFFHCAHGKDRTGVLAGLIRVFTQGWSQENAWKEMRAYGFTPFEYALHAYWKAQGYVDSSLFKKLNSKTTAFENSRVSPTDTAAVSQAGLPDIGKWMIDPSGRVASWFGEKFDGKNIREPINVIFRVRTQNQRIAQATLLFDLAKAGFLNRFGHSDHYSALIESTFVGQDFQGYKLGFSDGSLFEPNNHGRLFGPFSAGEFIYYLGSWSREGYTRTGLLPWQFKHPFVSFAEARQALVTGIKGTSGNVVCTKVYLGNEIMDSDSETTADHDGHAELIELDPIRVF